MTAYLNEEQQVEAIKKWWKENGKSVVIGVVLGFSVIFGWQGWQKYHVAQGEAASNLYIGMQNLLSAGKVDTAVEAGKRLLGEHTDSVYASFAALKLAQLMYERGDKANASENLQWVVSHAPDAAIADLAKMRLSRVQLDQQQYDQALATLDSVDPTFMPGVTAELRGDIARAKGDIDAARKAYQQALATGSGIHDSVQMKLLEIGEGKSS